MRSLRYLKKNIVDYMIKHDGVSSPLNIENEVQFMH